MSDVLTANLLAAIEDASRRPLNPDIPNRGPLAQPNYKVKPSDIEVKEHLWNAFDHNETEISAYWLIKLAQRNGDWRPFTREDVEAVYSEKFKDGYTFNLLVERGVGYGRPGERYLWGGGWIVLSEGRYYFTEEFIERCYLSTTGDRKEIERRWPWENEPREYY